jgi:hypothetical protein
MLGLCLVAVFATGAFAASSALAIKNPTKSPKIFVNCPINGTAQGLEEIRPDTDCVFGATEEKEGGQFTVGPITVPLAKQIVLQYGFAFNSNHEAEEAANRGEPLEATLDFYIAPTHGAQAITPTPEKVPGEPIAHITEAEQNELGWPESLKYSYALAQKHKTVKTVYETIEGAGNPTTSVQYIIDGEKPGVVAPVKIKGENKWLSELGDVCYIGSEAEPIVQHLTSGESTSPLTGETITGFKGELEFIENRAAKATTVVLHDSDLVDNTYAVPGASCTGPYSAEISATINKEFDLPQPAGASVTELKGTLYTTTPAVAEQGGA